MSAAFIVALLAGLFGAFFATPLSQAHAAAPTDCHNFSPNAIPIASGLDTIVQVDKNGTVLATVGSLSIDVYYCQSYQSVFARFIYHSTSAVTTITGQCYVHDETAGAPSTYGCDGGLNNDQWVDTQLVASGLGDHWIAGWLNVYNLDITCQDSAGIIQAPCLSSDGTATGQPVITGQ